MKFDLDSGRSIILLFIRRNITLFISIIFLRVSNFNASVIDSSVLAEISNGIRIIIPIVNL